MGQRETGTARDGDVWLERGVQRKDGGVTVEYTISGTDEETTVRVREPLDESVDLTEAGFHPEREPTDWSLEDGMLSFETTVPAGEPFETVFGAVADEPFLAGEPEIERVDESSGGLFASVRGLFGSSDADTESASAPEHDEAVTMEPDSGSELDAGKMLAEDEGAESDESEDSADEPLVPDAEGGHDMTSENEGALDEGADDVSADEGENNGPANEEADEQTADEPTDRDDNRPAGGGSPPEGRGTGGDTAPSPDDDEDGSDGGPEQPAPNPTETAEAVVELVEENDAVREALRDALETGEEEADEEAAGEADVPESVDTRLRHVQSRVDDLAAYTAAFEESIDEHGRPAEAFSELQSETSALREDVSAVRDEMEELRAEQAELAGRVEEIAEENESLRTELVEAGEQREARLDRLESDVDGVATDLRHARDGMEEELETVRDEIQELQSMRETLTSAFGGMGGANDSAETEATDERTEAEPEAESERPE